MSDKKLYAVNVQIEFDMIVAAENKQEAEDVAYYNWQEELRNIEAEPYTNAMPVKKDDKRWIETEYAGLDGIPFTNDHDQTTLEEYFKRLETNNG